MAQDTATDTVEVSFRPQTWKTMYGEERAVSAPPKGETDFRVPIADAIDDNGELLPDCSTASDQLKDHPRAPQWVRDYEGPFNVVLNESGEL